MNINSIFSQFNTFSENKSRIENNKTKEFQSKLNSAVYNKGKKDEYVQSAQKTVSNFGIYRCPNILSSLVSQFPIETSHYRKEEADKQMQERQLENYFVNINGNTEIKYLTRNGKEGKEADVLLLTDAERKQLEKIKDEYMKDPNSAENNEDGTDSNIIVNADGSRVLVVTMKIGGMESTISIKISDPTEFAWNENNEQSELENGEEISNEMESVEK